MLESMILGGAGHTSPPGVCIVVTEPPGAWPSVSDVRAAAGRASSGDWVASAIALDTPILSRLLTLVTLRWRLRRTARALARGGAGIVASYGLDPCLAAPACLFELHSSASGYADRCLRPRGSAMGLRRLVAWWCGCDPALGGVVVLGRKP